MALLAKVSTAAAHGLMLGWAAVAHEIALSIAHGSYHKHGRAAAWSTP